MSGFDWPGLMRAGLQGLGLHPAEFWALTPAELRLMLGEAQAPEPMGRRRLEELRTAYPDAVQRQDHGGDGDERL